MTPCTLTVSVETFQDQTLRKATSETHLLPGQIHGPALNGTKIGWVCWNSIFGASLHEQDQMQMIGIYILVATLWCIFPCAIAPVVGLFLPWTNTLHAWHCVHPP